MKCFYNKILQGASALRPALVQDGSNFLVEKVVPVFCLSEK